MASTKVVGVSFDGRQEILKDINEMIDEVVAIREPENPYDVNAIHVYAKKDDDSLHSCGYINRNLAKKLSEEIDNGKELVIEDYAIIGGGDKNYGMVIEYELS